MKIGVALAGGGLKGVAHIGALKALEELGINIEYISGTSSGAAMATLYALGYTPSEMEKITEESYKKIVKIKKRTIIKYVLQSMWHRKIQVQGIIKGESVEKIVEEYANKKQVYNMTDIKKNFAMIAADAKTTNKCVFISKNINTTKDVEYVSNIPIGKAVRASMAFPAIFTPCEYEDYCFIDGGTVDNMPVKELTDMGADKTISISFTLDEFTGKENLFSVILRACDIFSLKDVKKGQDISDISIEIDMRNAKLLSIDNIKASIQIGYDTVMKNKEKILRMVEGK